MEFLAQFHPPLHHRHPISPLYIPAAIALTILPFLIPGSNNGKILTTFPLLAMLFIALPCYTGGSAIEDYNLGAALFTYLTNYVETVIFTPNNIKLRLQGSDREMSIDDCETAWERLKWALQLQTTTRGVGWNWQVKNVPPLREGELGKWDFVRRRAGTAVRFWLLKNLSLYLLGWVLTLRDEVGEVVLPRWALNALVGWLAACWGYQGLLCTYELAASICGAIGVSQPKDWPPIFGRLRDAWSVRQMWSSVWHQLMRRMCQQPAIRMARFFGLPKGTLRSKYFQLYFAFFMSMLLHDWNIFVTTRKDGGEFWFFLIQPVAISCEDFVQFCWRRFVSRGSNLEPLEKIAGWSWTFLWFSYCLPVFAQNMVEAKVITEDSPKAVLRLGRQHAENFLQ